MPGGGRNDRSEAIITQGAGQLEGAAIGQAQRAHQRPAVAVRQAVMIGHLGLGPVEQGDDIPALDIRIHDMDMAAGIAKATLIETDDEITGISGTSGGIGGGQCAAGQRLVQRGLATRGQA